MKKIPHDIIQKGKKITKKDNKVLYHDYYYAPVGLYGKKLYIIIFLSLT